MVMNKQFCLKNAFIFLLITVILILISFYSSYAQTDTHMDIPQKSQSSTFTSAEFNLLLKDHQNAGVFNVLNYGATGDGSTDDRLLIQNTIDAAHTQSGEVYLPEGTYYATARSADSVVFTMKSGMRISGAGVDATIIKLTDDTDKYFGIFASSTKGADAVSDVIIENLTIDCNGTNNLPANLGAITEADQFVFLMYNAQNITIRNVKFKDIVSTNTVVFNGVNCKDLYLENCIFEDVGKATFDHDHSTIYTKAENVHILNNRFYATSAGANGARTAIETHGSNHTIIGNEVVGYKQAMNITGVNATDDKNIIISNNRADSVSIGINLWSFQSGAHTSGAGLDGLIITNNIIGISQSAFHSKSGLKSFKGIQIVPDVSLTSLPLKNVNISNNTIRFEDETGSTLNTDNYASGLAFRSVDSMEIRNFKVNNNIIENSPKWGMSSFGLNLWYGEFNDNLFVNCKSNDTTFSYNSGVQFFDTDFHSVEIKNNMVVDDRDSTRIEFGYHIVRRDSSDNLDISGNKAHAYGSDQTTFTTVQYVHPDITLQGQGQEYTAFAFAANTDSMITGAGTWTLINDADTTLWTYNSLTTKTITVLAVSNKGYGFILPSTAVYKIIMSLTFKKAAGTDVVEISMEKNGEGTPTNPSQILSLDTGYNSVMLAYATNYTSGDTLRPFYKLTTASDSTLITNGQLIIERMDWY